MNSDTRHDAEGPSVDNVTVSRKLNRKWGHCSLMSGSFRAIRTCSGLLPLILALSLTAALAAPVFGQQNAPKSRDPLAEMLLRKGILTPEDMKQLDEAATPRQAEVLLEHILLSKGVLTAAEYTELAGEPAPLPSPEASNAVVEAKSVAPVSAPVNAAPAAAAGAVSSSNTQAVTRPDGPVMKNEPAAVKPPAPAVIAAIAPIRALPVGGVARESFVPAFKVDGVAFRPYGFLKATAIEDSSSPNGDDFPLPGFLCDTGPDGSPEFHLKARSSRIGLNVAWSDQNAKWSISGKLEADFEGNFNRSNNRNISTIRSSNLSVRLAYGRMDYRFNDKNSFSALFGQDWSPFASSTLPNIVEITSYGIGYGILYERTPQMRVGYTHKWNGLQIMPEFAVTLPAVGLDPAAANISQQLAYGERQGVDSNRPDIEGRIVAQWQLDHAPGVAPAQFIVSGERGNRTAIVQAASIPGAYQKTFATGATGSSHTDGWDFEWQLPTRYATLIGKFYRGADLKFFFVNQLFTYFNDTTGLTNLATVASIDGASNIVLGTNAAGQQVVAPERPVRTEGGWVQLGLPLSRIFGASPTSRNSGWSLYGLYSIDQAKTRDLDKLGATGNRRFSTMAVGTLNYNFNRWVTFSFEQSLYTTHANPEEPLPLFKGVPSREWNDVREEFGPIFTF